MLNAEEQIEVLALVSSTKNLILSEQEKAEVTVKGAADYVTNVDVAVQEFLKRELAERFPDVRMLAEEQVNTGFMEEGKYWILDPIDGTTNLIHDMKLSAVALGYYENGEITFGAVYNPFMDELFHASLGGRAWLNGKRITVAHDRELKDAVIAFGPCPYEKEQYTEENFAVFKKLIPAFGGLPPHRISGAGSVLYRLRARRGVSGAQPEAMGLFRRIDYPDRSGW